MVEARAGCESSIDVCVDLWMEITHLLQEIVDLIDSNTVESCSNVQFALAGELLKLVERVLLVIQEGVEENE